MMKIAFYFLAATCLIGLSAADLSAFENTELENIDSNLNEALQGDGNVRILWPDDIVTRPTQRPSTTTTTTVPTTTTTTTPEPTTTTTTIRPRPTRPPRPTTTSTTTRRPIPTRPPRPTTSPRPTRPLPPGFFLRRPQIYNNAVNSLKPFASELVNIVQNNGGKQRTIQRNQILYNIRSSGQRLLDGESNE